MNHDSLTVKMEQELYNMMRVHEVYSSGYVDLHNALAVYHPRGYDNIRNFHVKKVHVLPKNIKESGAVFTEFVEKEKKRRSDNVLEILDFETGEQLFGASTYGTVNHRTPIADEKLVKLLGTNTKNKRTGAPIGDKALSNRVKADLADLTSSSLGSPSNKFRSRAKKIDQGVFVVDDAEGKKHVLVLNKLPGSYKSTSHIEQERYFFDTSNSNFVKDPLFNLQEGSSKGTAVGTPISTNRPNTPRSPIQFRLRDEPEQPNIE